jgi:hypothetical protein
MAEWLALTTQKEWVVFFLSLLTASVEVEPMLIVIANDPSMLEYMLHPIIVIKDGSRAPNGEVVA